MIEVNKKLYNWYIGMTVVDILKIIEVGSKDVVAIVNEKLVRREDYDVFIVSDKSIVKILSAVSEG